jgi:hypothetical protein
LSNKLEEIVIHRLEDKCAPVEDLVDWQVKQRVCVLPETRTDSFIKVDEDVLWDLLAQTRHSHTFDLVW